MKFFEIFFQLYFVLDAQLFLKEDHAKKYIMNKAYCKIKQNKNNSHARG